MHCTYSLFTLKKPRCSLSFTSQEQKLVLSVSALREKQSPLFGDYCNEVYSGEQLQEAFLVWKTWVWGRKRCWVGGSFM